MLTLIDWTGAGVGPRIVALAPLLMGALRPTGWDRAALENIASAYRAHVQLEARELERLGSALLIRQLWFAAWNYWTRTMKGNPPAGTEWWIPLPRTIYEPLGRAAGVAFSLKLDQRLIRIHPKPAVDRRDVSEPPVRFRRRTRERPQHGARREIDGVQVSARQHGRLLDWLASLIDDCVRSVGRWLRAGMALHVQHASGDRSRR